MALCHSDNHSLVCADHSFQLQLVLSLLFAKQAAMKAVVSTNQAVIVTTAKCHNYYRLCYSLYNSEILRIVYNSA